MDKISKELEGVISQMLRPLKGLSLSIVIEGLSNKKVIPFQKDDNKDITVLENLKKAADIVLNKINSTGIKRPRPNEVGNDIEPIVKASLSEVGYFSDTPMTLSGKKKSTGYPDIEFKDEFGRWHYIECKTYNIESIDTSFRSFYLSPSDDFKVSQDAHHFGFSFEIYVENSIGNLHIYKVNNWKILDLSKLELDVKYEFNSDNKRLYDKELILAEKNN
jgi:hypothetical protein